VPQTASGRFSTVVREPGWPLPSQEHAEFRMFESHVGQTDWPHIAMVSTIAGFLILDVLTALLIGCILGDAGQCLLTTQ
jgi:hypothetical protein